MFSGAKVTSRSIILATTAFAALSTAAPVWADDDASGAIIVTGERPEYGQGRTSTATKTDTPLIDVPQSITVITRDLIDNQNMRSMADVARYVPGVSMGQGEGHRDAPTLRGNSSTADFYVDGVRDDVQYFRDLYNAERIEVLKGSNAMIFGRGGGGGVINRVTEQADWTKRAELTLQAGSHDQRRAAIDVGTGLNEAFAVRLNTMYENSDSYRDYVNVERWGFNPTATILFTDNTKLRLGYEHFNDDRTVDRGVPSQNGRPLKIDESAFFGNPAQSYSDTNVDLFNLAYEHEFGDNLRLRNHLLFGDYQKFYQNVHANSSVDGIGNVNLQAYNSDTDRQNIFNQTDLIWDLSTGAIEHTILAGFEVGHQETRNMRSINESAGSVNIANPTTFIPVAFTGALQNNNKVDVDVAAVYLQDQIKLSEQFQIVAGIRYDRFEMDFDDRRSNNADFDSGDNLISPRLGLIYKPLEPVSVYGSYSVSYLPQSGDQFGSLDATTSALDPEEFENLELGVKWDIRPDLAFTAAIYRLDRSNTRALDPLTSLTVLTGEQRSKGIELGLAGSVTEDWQIIGGYAYQDVEITKTTSAAPAGRSAPLVPEQTFSLWNNYSFTPMWGAGVGVTHQTEMYASISNDVTLPSFTRVDAALYFKLNENVRAQVNVENVLGETYWGTAHNDNNITPGSPRAVRFTLTSKL